MKKVLMVLSKDVLPGDGLAYDSIANCKGALQCLEDHPDYDLIVITGGIFRKFQKTPVSVLMHNSIKTELEKLGYEEDSVIIEANSKDTYQNLWMSLALLTKNSVESDDISIVAHWAHALRAKYILWRRGMSSSVVALHYPIGLRGWCYEALAWVMTLLDSSGSGFLARRNRAARTFKELYHI